MVFYIFFGDFSDSVQRALYHTFVVFDISLSDENVV